jgi:hypothetical protein
LILLFLVTPSLALFGFVGQAYSQAQNISVSTSTGFSTLTIGTTTLAELTTSSIGSATGYIPGTFSPYDGPTVCFYVPYKFHVDTAQRILGNITGSNPFNFYIMSKPQYDYFVLTSPPCGSSYQALKVDYSITGFAVDWVGPYPGDYYIILENTSKFAIAYTIQLSAIEPSSSRIYSTTTLVQTLTFTQQQEVNTTIMSSESAIKQPGSVSDFTIPIAIVVLVGLIAAAVLVKWSKKAKW